MKKFLLVISMLSMFGSIEVGASMQNPFGGFDMDKLTAFKTYFTAQLTAVQAAIDSILDADKPHFVSQPEAAEPELTPEQAVIDSIPDAGKPHFVSQPEAAEPELTPEQAASAERFRNYLQKNKDENCLRVTYLYFSKTGELEFRVLADFLKANPSINCLTWGVSDHISTLFDILRTSTSITSIDLSLNQIKDTGAQDIADILRTNTSITSINLRLNNIREAGAKDIADALRTNTYITSINLSSNVIGDTGAQAIVDALKNNTSVKEIDLRDNYISGILKKELKDFAQKKGIIITVD